jgi:hypothetical protein
VDVEGALVLDKDGILVWEEKSSGKYLYIYIYIYIGINRGLLFAGPATAAIGGL